MVLSSGPADAEAGDTLRRVLARPGAGLLLDLDGTLVDSEPVHRAAYRGYFDARGWDVHDDQLLLFTGRRAAEVFSTVEGPWSGEDPDRITEGVIEVLRRSSAKPAPVAGARELLAACARRGLPVAVVTSAGIAWATRALEALTAPAGRLPPMVTAEDCQNGKPDPEPYRRGAELLGLDPARLVAVEDAPAGLASARAAGIGYLVGLRTTHRDGALDGADVQADDLVPVVRAVLTS